jgi:4-phosphopantoate--beta-alanine ligase
MKVSKSHPRSESLRQRHLIVEGMKKGIVADCGLISQGRGEAFDYLIGERTVDMALSAEMAAVALLLSADNPVISVNGNTAALVPKELVKLSNAVNAKLEVNLFYRSTEREKAIEKVLNKSGAKVVYGVGKKADKRVPKLDSPRAKVDSDGIWSSDVVLVPLEDGDRVEALISMKKKVIAIDLNPLSRTAQKADVSIIDNVVRAIPNMIEITGKMRKLPKEELIAFYKSFDNKKNLKKMTEIIRSGFC